MSRKIQCYEDGKCTWNYFKYGFDLELCGCGSNIYHLEYDEDEEIIYGVCNGCGEDIYTIDDKYVKETLSKGLWKYTDKDCGVNSIKKYHDCIKNLNKIKNDNKYKDIRDQIIEAIELIKESYNN